MEREKYVICGYPGMPLDSFSASMDSLRWAIGDVGNAKLWEKIQADIYNQMDNHNVKPTAELVRNMASKYIEIVNPETDEVWDTKGQKWIKE